MNELACFSEACGQRAFERFELLRAHLEDGIALAAIAREAKLSYRTLQHWLERYRTYGLVGLIPLRHGPNLLLVYSPTSCLLQSQQLKVEILFKSRNARVTDLHVRSFFERVAKILAKWITFTANFCKFDFRGEARPGNNLQNLGVLQTTFRN